MGFFPSIVECLVPAVLSAYYLRHSLKKTVLVFSGDLALREFIFRRLQQGDRLVLFYCKREETEACKKESKVPANFEC